MIGRQTGLWGDIWWRFRRHRMALVGGILLLAVTVAVLVGPLVYEQSPDLVDMAAANQPPGPGHPFGTDNLGRDMLARTLAGGRISLAVGLAAMILAMTAGTLVGVLAGYYRRLDGPLMRLTDVFLSLPLLPLLLVIMMLFRETLRAAFGPETGVFILIVLVIGLFNWMATARVVRAQVLSVKEQEFVLAAVCVGVPESRIVTRHILPNILSPIIVAATLSVAGAILTESALSFLGLGFPSDFPTWGRLLFDGKDYIQLAPHLVLWPGLFISVTVLSVNFLGDGLRDALDPRQRRR